MDFKMVIGQDDHNRRVDRILRKAFKDFPLSFIHRLLRKKQVCINNIPVKPEDRVQKGDILSIKGPAEQPTHPEKPVSPLQMAPPDVLYQGSGLLILNKPAGLAVHGPESLETMVQAWLQDKLPPSLSFKPGPLHRLDKPTSGIIAFSSSLDGARRFSQALQTGNIKKYYLALMDGTLEKEELWQDELYRDRDLKKTVRAEQEGQNAVMTLYPLGVKHPYSLVYIGLETGRTHQIRAQGAIHGHPLAGDKKYGGSFLKGGFFLHAWMLSVPEDTAPELPRLMKAPLPREWENRLILIFGDKIKKTLSETLPSFLS